MCVQPELPVLIGRLQVRSPPAKPFFSDTHKDGLSKRLMAPQADLGRLMSSHRSLSVAVHNFSRLVDSSLLKICRHRSLERCGFFAFELGFYFKLGLGCQR